MMVVNKLWCTVWMLLHWVLKESRNQIIKRHYWLLSIGERLGRQIWDLRSPVHVLLWPLAGFVRGSTPRLCLYTAANWYASCQLGFLTRSVYFSCLFHWPWKATAGRGQLSMYEYVFILWTHFLWTELAMTFFFNLLFIYSKGRMLQNTHDCYLAMLGSSYVLV